MKVQWPLVSIIIPTVFNQTDLRYCLKSIYELTYPKQKLEVIVIQNGKNSLSTTKKIFPAIKIIQNQQNLGFAIAVNQGICLSHGKYIFVINDDIVLSSETLKELVTAAGKNPKAIFGSIIYSKKNTKEIMSVGRQINRWTGNIKALTDLQKSPDWLDGCTLFFAKMLIEHVGLFDEEFSPALFEDVDFCFRAKYLGYNLIIVPSAHLLHRGSVTMNKNETQKYFYWYKNKLRFVLKHFPIINIISIFLFHFFIILPVRVIMVPDKKLSPLIKAFKWNLFHLRNTIIVRKKILYV